MAAALLWPSSEEKYFLYCKHASPAGLACLLFHGKGRNGRRHLLALAPLRGASRQLGNEPSQALRASSPEGSAKTVEGVFLASPFERLPPVGGRCRAATKRGQGVTEGDGEGAPAPLRGAAAAAAEGPSNRRSEKKVQRRRPPPVADTGRSCWGSGQQDTSAAQGTKWTLGTATRLSEAASIFPLRLLLWGLKGASSPFFVRGEWSPEDERGASKRPSCPLAQRSVLCNFRLFTAS